MEIIGHTASLDKTKGALKHYLISHPFDAVEMDFILTQDNVLVWSHDYKKNGVIVPKSTYKDLGEIVTLEEVLEVLDKDIHIMLDIKWGLNSNKKDLERLLECLEILKKFKGAVSVASFNSGLIKKLLEYRNDIEYAYLGLIINLFNTLKYHNRRNIKCLEKIEFVSLASELWEYLEEYKRYREIFPEAKVYAWIWDKLYSESEARLQCFVDKGVDGVLVSEPYVLKRILRKT